MRQKVFPAFPILPASAYRFWAIHRGTLTNQLATLVRVCIKLEQLLMGDIVNLRDFRKRQKRNQKQAGSAEKRALAGQNKADSLRIANEKEKAERHLTSHQIEQSERDGDETA